MSWRVTAASPTPLMAIWVRRHPSSPWAYPAGLAAGCGQLVSAETLPPDHCAARLHVHCAVSVLRLPEIGCAPTRELDVAAGGIGLRRDPAPAQVTGRRAPRRQR
jgi:hypothetical protein